MANLTTRTRTPLTGYAAACAPDTTPLPFENEWRYTAFANDYGAILKAIRRMYREGERMPWFTRAFAILSEPSLVKQETALSTLWTALGVESNAPTTDRPTAESKIARYAVDQRYLDGTPGSTRLLAGFDTENEAVKFALEMTIDESKFYLAVYDREQNRDVFSVGDGFMAGDDPAAVARDADTPPGESEGEA